MRTAWKPELIWDAQAQLGEGPRWIDHSRTLAWVDIEGRQICTFEPRSGVRHTYPTPSPVGAVAPRRDGGLVAALADGFWITDSSDGILRPFARVAHAADMQFNDGACDPQGRFWAGSMAVDEREGAGSLYRLAADGSVEKVLSTLTISNGIGWSPDGARMYFIDSATQRVDQFDFDGVSGAISDRRAFVHIDPAEGTPDGLCVDQEGGIWVALWGGGQVRRFSAAGVFDAVIHLPVSQVTACTLGGDEGRTLFITTARTGLDPDQLSREPQAGGLFAVEVKVPGAGALSFAS